MNASLNLQNKKGNTPLRKLFINIDWAAFNNHIDVVKLLLEKGA